MPLWLIPYAPPPTSPPHGRPSGPTVAEWTDPRYADLVTVWRLADPPPGMVGFVDPHP